MILAALLLAAQPVATQSVPVMISPAPVAAPDPARLAAARTVIDRVWPLGTYRRIMNATMDGMLKGMLGKMFDMPARDLAGAAGLPKEQAGALGDTSIGALAEGRDPHFRERMDIVMKVTMDEMTSLVDRMEPRVREGLVRAYARRFTAPQLGELAAFFATPTGSAYARDSMTLMTDPEMMTAMQSLMPELIAAMPTIMAKAQAAMAHLPPEPAKP